MYVAFLQLCRQTRVTVLFLCLWYTSEYGIPLLLYNAQFFRTLEEKVYSSMKDTNKILERNRNVVKA